MSKAEWVKKCSQIWKQLKQHKSSWVFMLPVEAEKLGLHDYHTIIKRPMDLGTIKANLDTGVISTPEQFKEDVLLTFQNAMTYNPESHDVHLMAKTLRELFLQKWEPQEAMIQEKWRVQQDGGGGQSFSTGKRPAEADIANENTPMSYEEKRELSANMNKLPGKKVGQAITAIHEKFPKVVMQNGEDPDEIEIDINALDTPTLRWLERMVQGVTSKPKSNQTKPNPGLATPAHVCTEAPLSAQTFAKKKKRQA